MFQWTEVRRSRRRRQSPTRWRPDSPPARWRPATPPRYWRYRSPPGDPRPHARSWGHDRRGVQGVMERAPPLPHRRIYPHSPNQPVPPPRALRRNGFGTGTHADSARGPDLPEDGHEVKRLPADPALGTINKKMLCGHQGGPPPAPGITRSGGTRTPHYRQDGGHLVHHD